jgi:predicted dehydrogenase
MDFVKFGIIGIGNMGSAHTNSVSELANAKLTAVCDINPKAFDRIKPEIRENIKCFTDAETFFKEADIDAVIIAVPHYSHPDLAIMAMQHGKHLIVEKPIAVHKKEAERMIAEAAKHPELKKSLMFNQRTLPAHKKIKSLIDNGELGKINRINWVITDWFRSQTYYDSGDWRASWRGEGGGVLLNQCPHQLDLWQWFFGLPKTVRGVVKFGKYHDIEVEDEVNVYMEYENGAVGNFIASTGEMPGTNRLEVTAEKGKLTYEGGKLLFIRNEIETSEFIKTTKKTFGISDNWVCDIPYFGDINQHRNVINNVAEAILKDTPLIAPMEEGIRGLELGNSMLLAGLKDKVVTLPMDSDEYAAELEKLVATSRYQKKTVSAAASAEDMSKSF